MAEVTEAELRRLVEDSEELGRHRRKVASNEALLDLLGCEHIRRNFVDALMAHIRECGLTFHERELLVQVNTRALGFGRLK